MRKFSCFQAVMSVLVVSFMTACGGGGGGGGGGGSSAGGPPASTAGSALFVADAASASIASQIDANPSAGSIVLDRLVHGSNTGLTTGITGLAIDSEADRLYVTPGNYSILVYDKAGTANGNVAPAATIAPKTLGNYRSPVLDKANDRLYVASLRDNVPIPRNCSIFVFDKISSASTTRLARTITLQFGEGEMPLLYSIAYDPVRDRIYAAIRTIYWFNSTTFTDSYLKIAVLEHASTLDGVVTPDSYINVGYSSNLHSVIVDSAQDRLYISSQSVVKVYDNVSTLSGSIPPTRYITLSGTSVTQLALDKKNNRLYVLSPDSVNIIDNASTADGYVSFKHIAVSNVTLSALAIKQ